MYRPDVLRQSLDQLSVTKSRSHKVRELQLEHLRLLKLIDDNSLGLASRKRLLPPIESLHCIQLDPDTAKTWDELQMNEFENRCQWERNVRSDFVYGVAPRKDTFRYENPYAKLAASVKRIVRSPEVERKAKDARTVISPLVSRLYDARATPSLDERESLLSNTENTPEGINWFQLPGKKKVLEIRKSPDRGRPAQKQYSAVGSLPTTPPRQVFHNAEQALHPIASDQTQGQDADKRFHQAWTTTQFATPDAGRTVQWSSHDASAVLKDSSDSSSSNNSADRAVKAMIPEPALYDLAAQLDTSLVLVTPPQLPRTKERVDASSTRSLTERELEEKREQVMRDMKEETQRLMREQYMPTRVFDMAHRRNYKGPGTEKRLY